MEEFNAEQSYMMNGHGKKETCWDVVDNDGNEVAAVIFSEKYARLFAAAPDLFAALEGIVENCCISCDGKCDLLKDGRAAIARAKGEEKQAASDGLIMSDAIQNAAKEQKK